MSCAARLRPMFLSVLFSMLSVCFSSNNLENMKILCIFVDILFGYEIK